MEGWIECKRDIGRCGTAATTAIAAAATLATITRGIGIHAISINTLSTNILRRRSAHLHTPSIHIYSETLQWNIHNENKYEYNITGQRQSDNRSWLCETH
jgi:hypothetical protein